ncbi:BCCT family transporter [Streptomyces sp. NPDC002851]
MAPRVFITAAVIIVAFVLYAIVGQEDAASDMSTIQEKLGANLSWYYLILVSLFAIFVLWVGLGRFGRLRLGKDGEKPEYSTAAWLSMLFAAGMGIGLVYFGTAEPLSFLTAPRPGVLPEGADASDYTSQAQDAAMVQTYLHWGIHPWAIYVVVGLAVAYATFRRGRPMSIRYALEPLLGDRVKGIWGDVIDIIAIVGTLFGVATSLGLGVMQIAGGMDFLNWTEDGSGSKGFMVLIIASITALAVISVVTGISKGIKWLSTINMWLAGGLLLFVLITGPTLFVLNGFATNIGGYFQNLLRLSFDTGASQGAEGTGFVTAWTVFYWGWWISWAPFVGVFIARISRGRTVREFVCGVLVVPVILTFFWFAVMGGSAIWNQAGGHTDFLVDQGDGTKAIDTNSSLFQLLDVLPAGALIGAGAIVLIVLFFVTSSDSGSFVVDMLASGGELTPPKWSRVFWGVMEGAVAAALLLASDLATASALNTLKTTAILIALPFSIVMIGMCFATFRAFARDQRAYKQAMERRREEKLVEETVQALEGGGGDTPERTPTS